MIRLPRIPLLSDPSLDLLLAALAAAGAIVLAVLIGLGLACLIKVALEALVDGEDLEP